MAAQSRNILHYSLIRLQASGAKLAQGTCTTKMDQSQFATVTSDEISKINEEAIPDNTKKATKFGLAVFTEKLCLFNLNFIDETGEKVSILLQKRPNLGRFQKTKIFMIIAEILKA